MPSPPALASVLPSGENARSFTQPTWPLSTHTSCRDFTPTARIWQSVAPQNRYSPSGEKATLSTSSVGRSNPARNAPFTAS